MDKENTPVEGVIDPTVDEIPAERTTYVESFAEEIERSRMRMHLRVFSWLEYVLPCVLILLVALALLSFGAWLWNILAPFGWRWLEEERIDLLQGFFFSGVSGALLTTFWRWYLEQQREKRRQG